MSDREHMLKLIGHTFEFVVATKNTLFIGDETSKMFTLQNAEKLRECFLKFLRTNADSISSASFRDPERTHKLHTSKISAVRNCSMNVEFYLVQ